ncbi:hypothetical protein G7K71_09615 [Desulfofundulus sp. TPOSR]|uniref:Uncharacterized protein n=1 Tax=Desulfofundulus kuznetsovii (strain DSM 6115 / VKM B-1805 / 17) TaxID=760568 RepID=A0AAU8PDI2_DESK7|nr:hypothetical protein [Desulfofundulus sp. TPOSR]AEG16262.1 hypothetical protein Desku_2748 [Desulfofundulus kuznetsovii DSM 6115]NHM27239.1 hypothetical protein [Desulfofundulus sp. TPOSR]
MPAGNKAPKVKRLKKKEPRFAPGKEDLLEQPATPEEKKRGEFTRVTTLSFDEVEPG